MTVEVEGPQVCHRGCGPRPRVRKAGRRYCRLQVGHMEVQGFCEEGAGGDAAPGAQELARLAMALVKHYVPR